MIDSKMGAHVVQYSGGAGSWATAKRVAELHGTDNLVLLCANTNSEADDWLEFVVESAANVGGELVMLDNGGRTTWDVFNDQNFIGNSRVSLCSRVLKTEPLRGWLDANCDPAKDIIYLGYDWTEAHRLEKARPHWVPWTIQAPLCDPPYTDKQEVLADLEAAGLVVPALYSRGFAHNNCGGACVKAGQASWRLLLTTDPERYAFEEEQERRFRERTGKDVAILRDRSGGVSTPLTLEDFRLAWESSQEATPSLFDADDWGACSCMEATTVSETGVVLRTDSGDVE